MLNSNSGTVIWCVTKTGNFTEEGSPSAGVSLANPPVGDRTKLPVVSFRTPLDATVAVAALALHNFYYEDSCLPAGYRRLSLRRLHSVLEEDPYRRRGTVATQAISLTGVKMDLLQI